MGFYGNIFYQIANSFGKFIIKNSGLVKEEFPTSVPTEGTPTTAIGLDATYNFDSGNRWIKLAPTDEATMAIYHSPIPEKSSTITTNSIQTFDKISEVPEDVETTDLIAGDYIAIPLLAYDKAGHVVGSDNTKYFRLPITNIEADIQDLQESMAEISTNDTTQNEDITNLKTFKDNFEKEIELTFVGDKTLYTTSSSDISITQALGSINNLQKYYNQDKTKYSKWNGTSATLNTSKAILDLDSRVENVENSLGVIGVGTDLKTGDSKTVIEALNSLYTLITNMATNYQELNAKVIDLTDRVSALEGS